jgi:hypothetical protein
LVEGVGQRSIERSTVIWPGHGGQKAIDRGVPIACLEQLDRWREPAGPGAGNGQRRLDQGERVHDLGASIASWSASAPEECPTTCARAMPRV